MTPADCICSRRAPDGEQQAGILDPNVLLPGSCPTHQHSDPSVERLLIETKCAACSIRYVQIRVSIWKNVVSDDGILVMFRKIIEVLVHIPVREMLQHILANDKIGLR